MQRMSHAVRAISGLALAAALGVPAAAEEKSTKPRLAVLEFKTPAGGAATAPLEVVDFSWGEADAPPRAGGSNQMSMDDTAGKAKAAAPAAVSHDLRTNVVARTAPPPGPGTGPYRANDRLRNAGPKNGHAAGGDPDRPIVAGRVPNPSSASVGANETITVGGGRTETAFGGRRLPVGSKLTVQVTRPLAKGSVWIRVATPWSACRVGARYPSLELAEGAQAYTLEDVTVASCGDADDRPTEEVAFYYNKVTVRGWDPKRKEE